MTHTIYLVPFGMLASLAVAALVAVTEWVGR